LLSTLEVSTNGLTTWHTGPNGTSSTVISAPPWLSKTITETAPDNSYSISLYQTGRLVSVTHYDSLNTQIRKTTYGYDAHGRRNTVIDARNGTTIYTFNDADQVVTETTPSPGNGQPAQTTTTLCYRPDHETRISG
jgi:YD repeat-containing protein